MYSILLILPYFGRFNNYFDFWLKSVEYNSTIDFLVVTDDNGTIDFPSNVRVVNMSFEALRSRIQDCFDFQIALPSPYKLCDFKPAYGVIFSEYVQGYDFWGHCDCDLIFGDIRKFVTAEVLSRYDRIFTYGHLCLYRNTPEVNSIFMSSVLGVRNYQNVFSSFINQAFDEMCGMTPIWEHQRPGATYTLECFDDIDYKSFLFSPMGKNLKSVFYSFDCGRLERHTDGHNGISSTKEVCYVHFQKRRMKRETDNVDMYWIIPNSFITYNCKMRKIEHRAPLVYLYPWKVRLSSSIKKIKNKLYGRR